MALPAFCGSIGTFNQWFDFGWSGNAPTDAFALGPSSAYSVNGTSVLGITCSGGIYPCDSFSQPFTFSGAATLVVQDLFFAGDQFQIYDNSSLIFTTSTPVTGQPSCGNDRVACAASSDLSHGSFLFGAGAHNISIVVIAEPVGINNGQAVLELLAPPPVPEPTTLSMMGIGLGALLVGWRARRKS